MRARAIARFQAIVQHQLLEWDAEGKMLFSMPWWDGSGALRVDRPDGPESRMALFEDGPTLGALLRRLESFLLQLRVPEPYGLLYLKARVPRGGCDSCGRKIPPGAWPRCELCEVAAAAALFWDERARERARARGEAR